MIELFYVHHEDLNREFTCRLITADYRGLALSCPRDEQRSAFGIFSSCPVMTLLIILRLALLGYEIWSEV
jgi:hypothetical protein